MSVAIYSKDPGDKDPFSIDYSDWLVTRGIGLTLIDSAWTVPAGLTLISESFTTTVATVIVGGGTDGQDYEIVNHVKLSDNFQEHEDSITIQVRQAEAGSSQDATDRSNALALILREIKPKVVPPLDMDDIEATLDSNKAATTWQPATFYPVGTRILPPTPRTGVWYLVTQPGTSQSSARAFNQWPTRFGVEFADGSSDPQLILEVQGSDSIFRTNHGDPSSVNCYDVGGAERQCVWDALRLASQMVDDGDVSFDQITEHLKGLLERFYPIRFPISVLRA